MIPSIGHIPAAAAKKFGDKTALVLPERSLSFNDLEKLSNNFANALVTLGIQPGDRVTLYSGNCWEWVVSCADDLRVPSGAPKSIFNL